MNASQAVAHGRETLSPFDRVLGQHGVEPLRRGRVTTLQVNVGKYCNQTCHHCHVDAGPTRTEIMSRDTVERVLEVLAASPSIETVDITGGAPELCPSFECLVVESRALGKRVIDRCNLTVLLVPGREELVRFLAENRVAIVASLPCYLEENVDRQRGHGVFQKSLDALERLNALGYGKPGSPLELDLVYNPIGAHLPPSQAKLEADYKYQLSTRYGIEFHRLFTLTNMPIRRFAAELDRTGMHEAYMSLLVNHFNPTTVPGLMCRSLLSVGWDGSLYDCDFNQMLDIRLGQMPDTRLGQMPGMRLGPTLEAHRAQTVDAPHGQMLDSERVHDLPVGNDAPALSPLRTVRTIDSFSSLEGQRIATAKHCFGCTAGSGSSCGGALA